MRRRNHRVFERAVVMSTRGRHRVQKAKQLRSHNGLRIGKHYSHRRPLPPLPLLILHPISIRQALITRKHPSLCPWSSCPVYVNHTPYHFPGFPSLLGAVNSIRNSLLPLALVDAGRESSVRTGCGGYRPVLEKSNDGERMRKEREEVREDR